MYRTTSGSLSTTSHTNMLIAGIVLLLLAGLYVTIERGESTGDRVLRWMVIAGAILMALQIGSGALR